jgi:hypothetical protein
MRTQILLQRLPSGDLSYRICESDGELVARWMPGGPLLGALDRGGFDLYSDALSFKLGIDLVRAEAGVLDVHARDIHAEQTELDADQRGRRSPDLPLFEAA